MYVTESEYFNITDRNDFSFTDQRAKMASRLLDSRIGNYVRLDDSDSDYDGYKLNLDNLRAWQKDVVKTWVAWMIAALYDNNDSPDTFESIKLGRFSITENDKDTDNNLPEMVRFADMQLRDAKIINRQVRSTRYVNRKEDECI